MLEIMLSPFGSFGFLGKEKTSTFANGAFASTPSTHGLILKNQWIKRQKKQLKKWCLENNGLPNFFGLNLC